MKRLGVLFLFSIMALGVASAMPMQNAYAVTETVVVAGTVITSPTTATVTFSGSVDFLTADFSDLVIDGQQRTIDSVTGTSPGTVATITFSGGLPVETDGTGTVDIATIEDIGSGNDVVAVPISH